jgi:hypothetical protein
VKNSRMSVKFSILMHALIAYSFSGTVCAQQAPTLKEAVRDQYVDVLDEQVLQGLQHDESLDRLDVYSHFLTEQELQDGSLSPDAEAFVRLLGSDALYLRIPAFHVKTSAQVHQALAATIQQAHALIVIDLRGNRGGLLNAAVEVADEFIAEGVLASTKGRQDASNLVFIAKPNGLFEGKRLVVIIDKKTASAAELLAGILKISSGACLVGQNSYGKSAVQSHIQLSNGEALSLTTAVYYFSNAETVSEYGLKPDVRISNRQLKHYPVRRIQDVDTVSNQLNPVLHTAMHCSIR